MTTCAPPIPTSASSVGRCSRCFPTIRPCRRLRRGQPAGRRFSVWSRRRAAEAMADPAIRRAFAACARAALRGTLLGAVNAPLLTDAARWSTSSIASMTPAPRPTATRSKSWKASPRASSPWTGNWRFDYVNREAHRILERHARRPGGQGPVGRVSGAGGHASSSGTTGTRCASARRSRSPRSTRTTSAGTRCTTFPGARRRLGVFPRRDRAQARRGGARAAGRRIRAASGASTRRRSTTRRTSSTCSTWSIARSTPTKRCCKIWGVDDVRGKTWMDLGYEQWHADMHDREIEQVDRHARADPRRDAVHRHQRHARLRLHLRAGVRCRDGEVVAVAGTTRDITERQAAEQAMREQADAAGRSRPRQGRVPGDAVARAAQSAGAAAQLARAAAHAWRRRRRGRRADPRDDGAPGQPPGAAGRRPAGGVAHQPRHARRCAASASSWRDVVRNAVETSRSADRGRHGTTLRVELPDEPLWVDGDPVRLAQILANLLNNAAKYTDDGGHIDAACAARGRQRRRSACATTASASSPRTLPRMFEMFSRGDRDSGTQPGRTGHRPGAVAPAGRDARRHARRAERRAGHAAASSRCGCRSRRAGGGCAGAPLAAGCLRGPMHRGAGGGRQP